MHHTLMADIGKCILAAAVLGLPAYLFRVPLLLAYLIAGVVLGPNLGFGFVTGAESIATLSEIGLVLLMFILGLEMDLKKLMQAGKAVLVNGVTQFVGCALLGLGFFYVVGSGYNLGPYGLVYLAIACSLSSTLVVVKILSDRMELDSMTSRITLGILVLQDFWAIAFLAVQPDLANLDVLSIGKSIGKASALVVIAFTMSRFVLPKIFKTAARYPELMLVVAMAWCFFVCGVANYLHLSLEMGALVAGISIASYPYHFDVAAKVMSLRDFFITLFFVSLGLQIPAPTLEIVWLALAIVGFVMVSRILTIFPVLHFLKYGNRASLLPSLNLGQLSEFALVLGSLGLTYGHISQSLLSAFVLAMVIAALISSFVIPKANDIYHAANAWIEKIGFKDKIAEGDEAAANSHASSIVLLGFHRNASSLLHELLERHSETIREKILVVDFNPEAHTKLKELGIPCRYADISSTDILHQLNLGQAEMLVSTVPDSFLKGISNLQLLRNLKAMAPEAHIIVTAESPSSAIEMYQEGAAFVFLPRIVGGEHLADVIERLQAQDSAPLRTREIDALKERREIIL